MLGHWIFVVIIAATYTGTVGPFLTDQSDIPIVRCERSCFETVCVGYVGTCLSVQSHTTDHMQQSCCALVTTLLTLLSTAQGLAVPESGQVRCGRAWAQVEQLFSES